MKLWDLLLRRAPNVQSEPLQITIHAEIIVSTPLEELEASDFVEETSSSGSGDNDKDPNEADTELENIYCILDYKDAAGHKTRRRVTLLKYREGQNADYVSAVCHERKALRSFRVDRIESVITYDGEVFDPRVFFAEMLGLRFRAEMATAPAVSARVPVSRSSARELRDHLRAPLSILVGAAIADGEIHLEEVDRIQQYAEREIFLLVREGYIAPAPSLELIQELSRMISVLRPQDRSLMGYIDQVCRWNEDRLDRLMRAIAEVIAADEKIVFQESAFAEEVISFTKSSYRERRAVVEGARQEIDPIC
jgi:WYL domain